MMARRLLAVLITNWMAKVFPGNAEHIQKNQRAARASLRRLDALGPGLSQAFWMDV
jgi:hypothetical protein